MNTNSPCKPMTVLVVDDEEHNVKLLEMLLNTEGYATISARNGKEALALAVAEKPGLILLDVMMPDMDGSDVAAAFHDDPELLHIKIVFLTAMLHKGEDTQSGKHSVFGKPVTTLELVAIIEQELGQGNTG